MLVRRPYKFFKKKSSFSYKIYLFSPKLIYFPVLSFIPSCLFFFDLGFKIAFAAYGTEDDKERNAYFTELIDALGTMKHHFDFILDAIVRMFLLMQNNIKPLKNAS